MAKSTKELANALGAQIVGKLPETGGGAFGAARLAKVVTEGGREGACSDERLTRLEFEAARRQRHKATRGTLSFAFGETHRTADRGENWARSAMPLRRRIRRSM